MGSTRTAVRLALTGGVVAVSGLLVTPAAPAQGGGSGAGVLAPGAQVEPVCTPTDPALTELSGLAVVGEKIHAVGDSGTDGAVAVLAGDCTVTATLPVPVDPYDVEDMGVGPDGRLWLADVGDNQRVRPTAALISLDPASGDGQLHRLTYPDGPRDAEALLVQRGGVPLIVSKEILAAGGIYRPSGGAALDDLASPGPTALERVGDVRLGPTDTPGGPVPVGASTLITGGAVSADGTVAALRTYTDVYLYSAPDGDLVRALTTTTPVRVAVPNDPQGEAIAFTVAGDLLVGSEAAGGPLPPLRIVRGAADLARDGAATASASAASAAPTPTPAGRDGTDGTADGTPATDDTGAATWATPVLLGGALVAGLASFALARRRARSGGR